MPKKKNYGDKTKDMSIIYTSLGEVFNVYRPRWKRKKPPGKLPMKTFNRSSQRIYGATERINRRAFVAGVNKTWYQIKKRFRLTKR